MINPRSLTVMVGGPAGLARDLVTRMLANAGFRLSSLEHAEDDDPAVTVVVEPQAGDWTELRAAGAPVLLISLRPLVPSEVAEAVLAGSEAVVQPDAGADDVVAALEVVAAGGTVMTPLEARALAEAARARPPESAPLRLTGREADILACIDRGDTVKQTAARLGIAAKTVENLQSRLFRKLGARNRAQAVNRAHTLGLLESEAS